MAKTKISEFSATPANNTDIDSINIAEGCAPSGINDAIRELMAQLKDFQTGAVGDSFNGPVGTTTAAAGAFTTLSASSTLAVTGVATLTAQPIMSSLTASRAVFTDASKGLVSNAITGTGNVVMSTSPTLVTPVLGAATGTSFQGIIGNVTPAAGAFTTVTASTAIGTTSGGTGLTSFTSGGVVYASSSSALATGSALTFDGTDMGIGGAPVTGLPLRLLRTSGGAEIRYQNTAATWDAGVLSTGDFEIFTGANKTIQFGVNGSEGLRLTSSSLYTASGINVGIGTSSPAYKVTSSISSTNTSITSFTNDNIVFTGVNTGTATANQLVPILFRYADGTYNGNGIITALRESATGRQQSFVFAPSNASGDPTEGLRLNSSGNLGLGVTPSAWNTDYRAYQLAGGGALFNNGGSTFLALSQNAFVNSSSQNTYIATAAATRYRQSAGTHLWDIAASGTAGNAISFTQAMTLDASGNLALGKTSASYRADVQGNFRFENTASGSLNGYFGCADTGSITLNFGGTTTPAKGRIFYSDNSDLFAFYTNSTERARIDSSGNFQVNTGGGGTSGGTGKITVRADSGSPMMVGNEAASGNLIQFAGNGSGVLGSVTHNGSSVAYNTTSDQRLKENIQDADSASSLIDSLQVRKFDWKLNSTHQRYGFVAQELVTVAPEAVYQPNDSDEMMAVDYSKLVPMLVKEIQSLRQRITTLEAR